MKALLKELHDLKEEKSPAETKEPGSGKAQPAKPGSQITL
jgi:hypothetical protein